MPRKLVTLPISTAEAVERIRHQKWMRDRTPTGKPASFDAALRELVRDGLTAWERKQGAKP